MRKSSIPHGAILILALALAVCADSPLSAQLAQQPELRYLEAGRGSALHSVPPRETILGLNIHTEGFRTF